MFHENVLETARFILAANLFRYFVVAGIAFVIFYWLLGKRIRHQKIQDKLPTLTDYRREIGYSILTILIFVVIGVLIFATPVIEYTRIYTDFAERGWGYWTFSIGAMIVLHDTYFYWTHRAMHHPKLFRAFHLTHHRSVNPSPWAAYAFSPLEGVVEALVIVPIVFLIPFHPSALGVWLVFMMVYNVYGHLGYELYPKGFHRHPIGRWLNTSVNHNLHHKHFDGNYGLYFLWWDRWMDTVREDYDTSYAATDAKRERTKRDTPPLAKT